MYKKRKKKLRVGFLLSKHASLNYSYQKTGSNCPGRGCKLSKRDALKGLKVDALRAELPQGENEI